jgi:hypothetical protein
MKKARYSVWMSKELWTLREATFLVLGYEPDRSLLGLASQRKDPQVDRFEQLYSDLCEIAVRDSKLLVYDPSGRPGYTVRQEPMNKKFLISWISNTGLVELPQELSQILDAPTQSDAMQPDWPYQHDTKLLKICRWVISKFWEGKEPDTAPTRDAIIKEIVETFNVSQGAAEAIDHVTRHDTLKKVGKKRRL